MTLLDERPAAVSPLEPSRGASPGLGRWRLATRLARREVRRRPGRTLLVTLLVAVPVMAMTIGSVIARTQADTWEERFERVAGAADLRLDVWPDGDVTSADVWASRFPDGSDVHVHHRVWATALAPTDESVGRVEPEATWVQFLDLDLGHPTTRGIVEILDGVAPAGLGEVALDRRTAEQFSVGIGDVLRLDAPQGEWTVTALVRNADSFRDHLVVFGAFDWTRVAGGHLGQVVLVDAPGTLGEEEAARYVTEYGGSGLALARALPPDWRSAQDGEVPTSTIAWGWVIGVLALGVVGIVIASAFATSARRQLVTLGQLAANGADRRLLRRTLSLQGSWSGLAGSAVGVAAALVILGLFRDVAEFVVSRRLGAYEISVLDLVAIIVTGTAAATVAAAIPARSTAKVPVMSALAGRRPLGRVPRRLVPIGVALFTAGLFLLVLAAAGSTGSNGSADLYAVTAVLGGVAVVGGMCCTTPAVVDLVGRIGSRLPGTWRLAARSLARTRTRTAAVVTAIAATGAFATAGATLVVSANTPVYDDAGATSALPADTVLIEAAAYQYDDAQPGMVDHHPYEPVPVPTDLVDGVVEITGGAAVARRAAVWDPAPFPADRYGVTADGRLADVNGRMAVADSALLDVIGLSERDRDRLDRVGAMSLRPDGVAELGGAPESEAVVLEIDGREPVEVDVAVNLDPFESFGGVWTTVVTEERAVALGLTIVDDGVFVRADGALAESTLRALVDLQRGFESAISGVGAVFDTGDDPAVSGASFLAVQLPAYPRDDIRTEVIELAIGATALLLILFVVAVALGLAAAESRDERDVLMAVGAPPSTMRRNAAQKAWAVAATGTFLAVPTGLLPAAVVLWALDDGNGSAPPLTVPWLTVALVVLAIPAVAGLVTWAGAALTQRLRPVRMSTLHAD